MSTPGPRSVHVGEVLLSLVLVFIGAFVIYETQGMIRLEKGRIAVLDADALRRRIY